MKIDLHSHSTHSDGLTTAVDLVHKMKAAGVAIFSLTDHDTTEGVEEAVVAGKKLGVEVVPGIEISSRYANEDVHVLGIGVDIASKPMQEKLAAMRASRIARVEKICAELGKLGKVLDAKAVFAEAGGKSVGRKHVARAMVKAGLVKTQQEAFDQYLGSGKPANVPPNELSPAEAVGLVRSAGGIAVLAHPGFFDDDGLVERILDETPVEGIEVFHQYDSPRKHLRYAGMAERRDLIMTGGSDFHGEAHKHAVELGVHLTPPAQWRRLAARLGR